MAKAKMSTRRKLAIASWGSPHEGNIYGKMVVDAGPAMEYINHLRVTTGEKVTITHLIGRAMAEALKQAPTLNGYIRLGNYVPFDTVDIAFLVALEEGADLAKVKVERVDQKAVVEIARELGERAGRLRKGQDSDFEKSKGLIRALPTWLLSRLLWLVGFLSSGLGLRIKALGVEPFPFGSCILTNVGMFGVDEGFAPPTPFARVPVYLLVGTVKDRPAVEDGKLIVQSQLTLSATIDHRFVDGYQIAVMAKVLRQVMANPWRLDGLEGPPKALPAEG